MAGHINDMVSQHWNTPKWLVDAVREALGGTIDLDPCSNDDSVVGARYEFRLPLVDGLAMPWDVLPNGSRIQTIYCNPPYGRDKERGTDIGDWIHKAKELDRAHDGDQDYRDQILVIPASTELVAWHEDIWDDCDAICFLKGRVKFLLEGVEKAGSTKGTAVIYYGKNERRFERAFDRLGRVIVF